MDVRRVRLAAAAPAADEHTVDQVLLGEIGERALGNAVLALDGRDRCKRPARAALALVLHGAHNALVAPVERVWQGPVGFPIVGGADFTTSVKIEGVHVEQHTAVLAVRERGELVQGQSVRVLRVFVEFADVIRGIQPDPEAEEELQAHVQLVVGAAPAEERELLLASVAQRGREQREEEQNHEMNLCAS